MAVSHFYALDFSDVISFKSFQNYSWSSSNFLNVFSPLLFDHKYTLDLQL